MAVVQACNLIAYINFIDIMIMGMEELNDAEVLIIGGAYCLDIASSLICVDY